MASQVPPSLRWSADPEHLLKTLGPPRVSVIIPHFNTPELLVKCLQAVAAQTLDHGWFEIIVVDNGSRLPMRLLEATWPGVRFLIERQPGPGPARNTGVRAARADILAFVDADVRVAPGWLMAGLKAVGRKPLAIFGGDIRIDVGDRKNMTDVEAFESVFSFRQKSYIQKKHYSVTANLIMTRAVFDRAGPFDGIDKPEDRALGERAYAMGIRTRYAPRMLAFHPARQNGEEIRRKFGRVAHQAFTQHVDRGKSLNLWDARAAAMAVSGVAHAPMMLFSRRVTGLGNRARGLRLLLQLRWHRALDMLELSRKARAGDQLALVNWNS
ncbi:glycosyltransferase [Sandaracinobacter neustonicus]|uniref:Glycosyltransferase n=1 Tax=Sandaracinobacter neustonicus TaxID=1715348 RepID=A0A501XGZ9_9SPHN|nr:glycosyltransferase [Sandaracinobacter neustonicus]TPE59826.1 glycosyltransferase [Sandaracinobacter neustonicus]